MLGVRVPEHGVVARYGQRDRRWHGADAVFTLSPWRGGL
ncbi:hypothetical protein SCATT_p05160 (plasmid) [Streptantibioticus cattleyicolor NRRL 8057 = DSM 46488]|uniref:Uncharacterized protein n=1 Tax=Streptantibioticus cattleyicolor (strain ATCC 35852 / DSM 46488 / JCM 4925 / NBRC 14057 / NRRL 8057) TaxID=1003195 RepID=G8XGF1_STREN|nr:hypothetical protein SCATT_p05160 [Streptantibioticus cattleyicolor NRRL 8057 = DSM 46488]